MEIKGIDVSTYQTGVNWKKVKESGGDFAIIRGGYGNNLHSQDDDEFRNHVRGCETVGLPYGMYFYTYMDSRKSLDSEVWHTLRLLKEVGPRCTYGVWLDVEEESLLGVPNLLELVTEYVNRIRAAGYPCGVYTGFAFTDGPLKNLPDSVPVWFAQYNSVCQYEGKNLEIWQYTDKGTVPGIEGDVDMNICYTDKYMPARKPMQVKVWTSRKGPKVCDVALKSPVSIEYQAHVLHGRWLPAVSGSDINVATRYAGNGKPIDAIRVVSKNPEFYVSYRVKTWRDGKWHFPKEGTAGIYGQAITEIEAQIRPVKMKLEAHVKPPMLK